MSDRRNQGARAAFDAPFISLRNAPIDSRPTDAAWPGLAWIEQKARIPTLRGKTTGPGHNFFNIALHGNDNTVVFYL